MERSLDKHSAFFTTIMIAWMGLLLTGISAWAQPREETPTVTPNSLMADHLVRLADQVMRQHTPVGADQIVRAGLLVDLAIQANVQDADAWLFRKRLASMAGDDEAVLDALTHYSELRPKDDAAQYDLLIAAASKHQTLKARVQSIKRVFETAGSNQLSKPLRSRLASYLAEAALQTGDETAFGKWLKLAVQLDQTNHHAARLMYDLAVTHKGSDLAVGQMLLQMIRSDPMDDMARHMLADLFVRQGDYQAAEQQYRVASLLGIKDGADRFLSSWILSLGAIGKTQAMLEMLDTMGEQPGQANAESLTQELQILRLAVLTQENRTDEASKAFSQLRRQFQQRVDMGDVNAAIDLAWWTAIFSPQLSSNFEKAVVAYAKANPENKIIQRTLGWTYYRAGKIDEATSVLHLLAENDEWALYGLARCAQSQGGPLYLGYLQKVIRLGAQHPAAMMAARDLADSGNAVRITPAGIAIKKTLEQLPPSVQVPSSEHHHAVVMNLQITPTTYAYMDPMVAQVTLRNNTELPLKLGEGASIPSRLYVYLSPWRAGQPVSGIAPIKVQMKRRLSLQPRETLRVPIRLDRGELGMMMALSPAATIGFSATAVLDPVISPKGKLTVGPRGGYAMIKFVNRRAIRPTPANIDQWINQFENPKDALSHMKLIARLSRLLGSMNHLAQTRQNAQRIAKAINSQFANLGTLGRAWTVMFIPTDKESQALVPAVHQLARQSDEPLVRIAYLAVHGQSDSAVVRAASHHKNPRISAFASAMLQASGQAKRPSSATSSTQPN